jgi:small-conductance mechanosensitive channel
MSRQDKRRIPFPPVLKLLVRGYLIILFVLLLEYFNLLNNVSLIIFTVTVISVAMMFGVGYLLVTYSRPVRASSMDIPNTVLFFVKGGIVLYFVSLLGYFRILPLQITSMLITIAAFVLMLVGVLSYLWEVVQRSRRLSRPKRVPRYRIRGQRHRGWQL